MQNAVLVCFQAGVLVAKAYSWAFYEEEGVAEEAVGSIPPLVYILVFLFSKKSEKLHGIIPLRHHGHM
jgi:hypothetical protein